MIAPAVSLAQVFAWYRLLALAESLGAALEPKPDDDEVIIYTGRNLAGAWVV